MNRKDKLRIINNWTHDFIINEAPSGSMYKYGSIVYKKYGLIWGEVYYTESYLLHRSVVNEAYRIIQEKVWTMVYE